MHLQLLTKRKRIRNMEINNKTVDGIVSISVSGRLDAATSVDADKHFSNTLEDGNYKLLIDLSGLEYISSAGLRVLLVVAKKVQQKGGRIALTNLTANVKEVFEISGFSAIFKIFAASSDAVEFLKN